LAILFSFNLVVYFYSHTYLIGIHPQMKKIDGSFPIHKREIFVRIKPSPVKYAPHFTGQAQGFSGKHTSCMSQPKTRGERRSGQKVPFMDGN
jgi:hypothetical protein